MSKHKTSLLKNVLTEAKKWNKLAHVRALARAAIGEPPPRSVIVSKKDRKTKHKFALDQDQD